MHLQTDKFNVAEMIVSVYDKIENIVGKEENAFFFRVVKSRDCVV